MGNIDYFIGVDVSKNSLSVCILFGNTKNYFEIANEKSEILKFFAMYGNLKSYAAFENTNTYNYDLMRAFDELGLPYARLDAFKFSHFLRHNSRLKTDKMDSYAIALYAFRFSIFCGLAIFMVNTRFLSVFSQILFSLAKAFNVFFSVM